MVIIGFRISLVVRSCVGPRQIADVFGDEFCSLLRYLLLLRLAKGLQLEQLFHSHGVMALRNFASGETVNLFRLRRHTGSRELRVAFKLVVLWQVHFFCAFPKQASR